MSPMRFLAAAATGTLLATACATAREVVDGMPVYRLSEVDLRPVLVGCSNYTAPLSTLSARGRMFSVPVTFVVHPTGTVAPWTVNLVGRPRIDPDAQETVLNMAKGCAFTPAQRGDTAVFVRVQRSFWVERTTPHVVSDTLPNPGARADTLFRDMRER